MIGPFDTADLVFCRYCGEASDGAEVVFVNGGSFHACDEQLAALREAGWDFDDDGEPLWNG